MLDDSIQLDEVGEDKERRWADGGEFDWVFGQSREEKVDIFEGDGWVGIGHHERLAADVREIGSQWGLFDEALFVE